MSDWIYLPDPSDPVAVVAAFQRAMDAVVSREALEALFRQRFNDQNYQHVHPNGHTPAVGTASIVLGKRQGKKSSVFLMVYERTSGGGLEVYVPPAIALRLTLKVPGTSYTARLQRDAGNQQYCGHLIVPTVTLQKAARVIVDLA